MKELIKDLTGSNSFRQVFRYNVFGRRVYFDPLTQLEYSGLTGALSAATFKGDQESKQLDKWRTNMIATHGSQFTDDYVNATADFGSLIHFGLLIIKEKSQIDWNEWKDYAGKYFEDFFLAKGMAVDSGLVNQMVYESCKHLSSVLQFCYERVQTIYAIEAPCFSDELKICTPIDFVANCRQTPKGEFSMTTINIKTSSQISNKHMDQASVENWMWNRCYPDYQCENTAILRTKDWTEGKTPTYDYKYLSQPEILLNVSQIIERLKLALNLYWRPTFFKHFEGVTKLGEFPVISVKRLGEV